MYSFTPAADTTIDLTLCTGTTDYDTKMYIYQGTCASPFFACNDDFCSTPFSYVSELTGVALTGGQTYYIVVDGYGGASGNYTIDVTFHADAGGQPGAADCTFAGLAPTALDTGVSYGGWPLYYWEVTGLSPACEPTGASWVGLKSFANPADCALLWMNGTGGDGNLLQYDGAAYSPQAADAALCITGAIVPVELQTFNVE